MAYNKNLNINQNNIVNISGSLITLTGSLSGSQISGTTAQYTLVSASNLFAGGVLYPTADGATGQIMVTDGAGTLTFQDPTSGDLTIRVKNKEATTILKGTPCYVTASDTSGNIAGILRADAGNPSRMPAACIAFEDIDAEAEGLAILAGFINGVDTSAFTSGEAVYVGVGGGYTNVRPTGSALVQPLGYVEKVDSSNGSGVVKGPGHHYILPNATPDHLWIAGANGVPAEVNKEVFATTGSNTFTGNQIISGNLTVTGSITELSTRRIKTNIESLNNELTTLTKLNPVSYTRIDDGRKEYGFISEEVKQVYPEFVIGEGINYPKMVSILVSAVKELSEKVEKQSTEIQLLRDNKTSLEVK